MVTGLNVLKSRQSFSEDFQIPQSSMSTHASRFFDFDSYRVDPVRRTLSRNGIPIPLTPKAFDTLLTLILNRGRIIPKDELLKSIWPDTFVEEATLAQNIFTLRKALGGSEGEQYVQTIPKRGYRFVANVTEEMEEGAVSVDQAGAASDKNQSSSRDAAISSIAVLPLRLASDDPHHEHVTDGIMESIVNSLSLLPELRIKACSTVVKYKGRELDPQEAGRELSVDSVLVGRLIPFGANLLVRMELVEVANGWQIWGEEYSQQLSNIQNLPLRRFV
jgi:DNA-binding winged helix-turn-helix (wHTH) protein